MRLSILQFLVALSQVSDELRFEALKFEDFPAHILELCLQQAFYRFTGLDLVRAKISQLFDFSQREAQRMHLPDEGQPLDVFS